MELNPKQQEAVNYLDGPLLIVAGAGSGKTRTLTARLINLINNGIDPKSILAITFTNKAAGEMRDRITNNLRLTANDKNRNNVVGRGSWVVGQPFIGTFHSFGARILKAEAKLLKRNSAFSIFDASDSMSLMKKIAKAMNLKKEHYKLPTISYQISKVKAMLYDKQELLDKYELEFFDLYEDQLMQNNAFDFDDLIEKVVWLFKNRNDVLKKYQNKFKYILIDEYQDVNTAQYELIKLLAGKYKNISAVGDDSQAIYGWRHADFRNFLNFEKDWADAKVIKLEQNYRSTSNIISAASTLIKNNKLQTIKDLWTENKDGESLKVVSAENSEDEADFISETIKRLSRNPGRESIAILYRTNAQSRALEQSFVQYQIPYKIFGGVKFYERKEIKDIVAALKIAFNPKDSLSAERIKKTFVKAVHTSLIPELISAGKKLTVLELISLFLKNSNYFEYLGRKFLNVNERIENINEFIAFAAEFHTLDELLERVSLMQSTDSPNKSLLASSYTLSPINLMTIHMAKGLEFENVFIAGVNEGLLPHQMSYGSLDELEEERRLMYVAMTRACKNLYLSFYHIPSRFLYEIPPELTTFTNSTGGANKLPNEDEIYID